MCPRQSLLPKSVVGNHVDPSSDLALGPLPKQIHLAKPPHPFHTSADGATRWSHNLTRCLTEQQPLNVQIMMRWEWDDIRPSQHARLPAVVTSLTIGSTDQGLLNRTHGILPLPSHPGCNSSYYKCLKVRQAHTCWHGQDDRTGPSNTKLHHDPLSSQVSGPLHYTTFLSVNVSEPRVDLHCSAHGASLAGFAPGITRVHNGLSSASCKHAVRTWHRLISARQER